MTRGALTTLWPAADCRALLARQALVAAGIAVAGVVAPVVAGSHRASQAVPADEVPVPAAYEPYAFLIGEWNVGPENGAAAAVTTFAWGPRKTFIRYSGGLLVKGEERPAFEGLLVYNGVRRALDMLLVLELQSGSLVQEQGIVRAQPDGSVVREITVYYSPGNALPPDWTTRAGAAGATSRFRHTFTPLTADRLATSILRESRGQWVPSFPGSDRLIMSRRSPDRARPR